jgi:hypothetical protein
MQDQLNQINKRLEEATGRGANSSNRHQR